MVEVPIKSKVLPIVLLFAVSSLLVLWNPLTYAYSTHLTAFTNAFPDSATDNNASCQVCHTNASNSPSGFNPFGSRVSSAGSSVNITTRLNSSYVQNHDSDSQGDSNIDEINSGTQPGWNATNPPGLNIPLNPQDPVAEANGPYTELGLSVTFSSNGSNDPDPSGSVASYSWNFGDGNSSSSANPTHTYASAGSYTATLTVTDNIGATDSDNASVTLIEPGEADVLLVDDDDNSPDVRSYYTAALDTLNLTYEIWDTNNSDNEPDALKLLQYQNKEIIWFTGDEFGGFAGPGAASETRLATYLENGGNLFISSQDYRYDRGLTSFMQDYLGIATASEASEDTLVTGVNQYDGQGPYALSYPFTDYNDAITPDASASLSFEGNVSGGNAVIKQTRQYRTAFWGFPLEAISTAPNRATALLRVLRTQPLADVLLVDDDDNSPDVLTYYTDALDALGKTYSIWDTRNTDEEPSPLALAQYKQIIWFTGNEFGGFSGPGSDGEAALSAYLDQGGKLFITSQDYEYDRGVTSFMLNYLGVSSISRDALNSLTSIAGRGAYVDLGALSISFPYFDYSDIVSPDSNASIVMVDANGDGGGIRKKTSTYETVFWAFPFEAIASAADRVKAMRRILAGDDQMCVAISLANDKVLIFCL